MSRVNVLWFRHGLRLHDNPALLEAASTPGKLLAVFIFDGKSAGTKNVGYNRMKFLLESLADLQSQLRHHGGNLFIFRGNPVDIFCSMNKEVPIGKICFEYDCEPIWRERDDEVKKFCSQNGIECIEKVSHTLWDPNLIIKTNGGIPPLTYQMFLHTVKIIGKPPRPVPNVNWSKVEFQQLPRDLISALDFLPDIPRPDYFGIYRELSNVEHIVEWIGGEKQALIHLQYRLQVEGDAFRMGLYLPNQARPDILGPPTSLSAHLRFGCLSVRKFYWDVHDLFKDIQKHYGYMFPEGPHITGQLIWREYFYTMSVNNINYGSMKGNDICLNIPWSPPSTEQLDKWKYGQTGFPLIDAAMRQLLTEGWLHHILRNAVATFLTRGGLWISWEYGFEHFLRFLLDADWSVCAGNWMWVSSSAFEKLLDSSKCTCPTALAWRLDPQGEYVCRYVPELRNLPKQFIHEPWKTPIEIQKEFRCIIGVDYPMPMIDFNATSRKNCYAMKVLREKLISETHADHTPPHCRPSNDDEIRTFFWLAD